MSVASIHEQRTLVRRLLDDSSAADAPTAYYALFHDPARSRGDAAFHSVKFLVFREIGGKSLGADSVLLHECARELLKTVFPPRHEQKVVALRGKAFGIDRADAARRTGDDGQPNAGGHNS